MIIILKVFLGVSFFKYKYYSLVSEQIIWSIFNWWCAITRYGTCSMGTHCFTSLQTDLWSPATHEILNKGLQKKWLRKQFFNNGGTHKIICKLCYHQGLLYTQTFPYLYVVYFSVDINCDEFILLLMPF